MRAGALTDFDVVEVLGSGSFSTVFKIRSKGADHGVYVLKETRNLSQSEQTQAHVAREVEMLLLARGCPGIVQYHASFIERDNHYTVMEYVGGGDLYKLVERYIAAKAYMDEATIWRYLFELGHAVAFLHSNGIIHRDIKCQNIMLTESGQIKLIDLGLACALPPGETLMDRCGTPIYMAVEMIRKQAYDHNADVWSLGCVLYILAQHRAPFVGTNLLELCKSIVDDVPPPLSSRYSPHLAQLISRMLCKNREARPSIMEVLSHPFFLHYPHFRPHIAPPLPPPIITYHHHDHGAATSSTLVANYVSCSNNMCPPVILTHNLPITPSLPPPPPLIYAPSRAVGISESNQMKADSSRGSNSTNNSHSHHHRRNNSNSNQGSGAMSVVIDTSTSSITAGAATSSVRVAPSLSHGTAGHKRPSSVPSTAPPVRRQHVHHYHQHQTRAMVAARRCVTGAGDLVEEDNGSDNEGEQEGEGQQQRVKGRVEQPLPEEEEGHLLTSKKRTRRSINNNTSAGGGVTTSEGKALEYMIDTPSMAGGRSSSRLVGGAQGEGGRRR